MKFENPLNIPVKFLIIMYTVGVAGHAVSYTRDLMFMMTPAVLLLTGFFVLIPLYRSIGEEDSRDALRFLLWIIVAYIATFFTEVAGVKTGMVFGPYSYGENLGAHVLGVPPVIGFNWVMMIVGSMAVATLMRLPLIPWIAASSLLPVFFDWIMEPVAITLNYWHWHEGTIPLQNYVAWWIISLVAVLSFKAVRLKIESKVAAAYFLIQLCYFVILGFLL